MEESTESNKRPGSKTSLEKEKNLWIKNTILEENATFPFKIIRMKG